MSRIARPLHVTLHDDSVQESNIARISGYGSSVTSKKRLARIPSYTRDDPMGPAVPDAPKLQRRSTNNPVAAKRPSKTAKATMRTSTSSTEELSEPEPILRFAPPKAKTPRSPSNRSPVQNEVKPGKKSPSNGIAIGSKVSVPSMGVSGTLRFLGPTEFKPGVWAGIELDDSGNGKNDGCVQGIRYFTCPPQKGLFIGDSKIVALDVDPPEEKTMAPNKLSPPIQRRSRQPIPESTRSSTYARRSKTLQSSQKRSKISATRSTDSTSKSSRYSVDKSVEPVPPLPEIIAQNDGAQKPEQRTPETLAPPAVAAVEPEVTEKAASPASGESQNRSTPNTVSEQELYHIYELLEKAQREKDKLSAEISSKEAAWERLVTTKESYALRIKEKDEEMTRLQQQLSDFQEKFETAQQQLQEKQNMLDKSVKDDSSQEQSLRRIEKLEGIIEDMKAKATGTMEAYETQLRESQGQLDHLRNSLKDQETMSAALERECDDLRKAGLEAINAYEASIQELKRQSHQAEEQKNSEITELNKTIANLRGDDYVVGGNYDSHDRYADEWHDQRIRLEEQLELATDEVEQERIRNATLANENDKLRKELQLFHMSSATSDDRFDALRRELETELQDKRRLMEEADAAFEAQARAEDENYQMKMARVKMERELEEAHIRIQLLEESGAAPPAENNSSEGAQLTAQLNEALQAKKLLEQECDKLRESQSGLEKECMRLMDELLAEQGSSSPHTDDANSVELRKRIQKLEDDLLQERLRYNDLEHEKRAEINHLSTELAELETLIENGVFEDNDLQEALDVERKKVQALEKELKVLKESKPAPEKKMDPYETNDPYCELCEEFGHDVMTCASLSSFDAHKSKKELYCENCDLSGVHSTVECPKQDEVF
ncbi:hypothetical protein BJV82DRAFT_598105 [Fennellomyces sp. T-0311]|nr:hypothetical protein BJV82DRAFT_598105 [Fennellomyces sp. T-0311]